MVSNIGFIFFMGAIPGLIGFILGFFGPIIFSPGSNQGPMLGIFITGPLAFLIGSAAGWIISYTNPESKIKRYYDNHFKV
jgi:hypothetical protein